MDRRNLLFFAASRVWTQEHEKRLALEKPVSMFAESVVRGATVEAYSGLAVASTDRSIVWPVQVALFLRIVNQQAHPITILGYRVEMKDRADEWKELTRVYGTERKIYALGDDPAKAWLVDLDKKPIEEVLIHKELKPHDPHWASVLLQYFPTISPSKSDTYLVTLYDAEARTYSQEVKPNNAAPNLAPAADFRLVHQEDLSRAKFVLTGR